jgi:OOP family OmpA-OmpF porin
MYFLFCFFCTGCLKIAVFNKKLNSISTTKRKEANMKAKHFVVSLFVLVLAFVMTGCAGIQTQTINKSCTSKNANALVRSGYTEKVNNFIIVQDASSTMGERTGKMYPYDSKLSESKDLLTCLNNSTPDQFDMNGGMRLFGPVYSEKGLVYGMTDYTKSGFMSAVNGITKTGGVTPLANAITYAAYDLLDTPGLTDNPGPTAMIIFSDGLNTDAPNPAAAAAAVKEMYGNNICIYTVLIGDSPQGKAVMNQIADAGVCGFATDSNAIGNAQGMDNFVEDVFLAKSGKPAQKISMTLLIEFDFDKDVVRSRHHGDVKKIADTLRRYPRANVELEGHTDNMGDDAYNMSLSKRRVDSVKRYLVEKFNVKASRISTVGYGESKPVASNDTAAGRQRNRRVVANIQ